MLMKYCPNPTCPFRRAVRKPAEYVEEARECSDCGSALVQTRPEFDVEPDEVGWDEMVPIMHVSDPNLLPVIESLLEGEGIAHHIHGANVQDLFGVGRVGAGFNVAAGQPTLFVDSRRAEEALQLIESASDSTGEDG
jgi:hypothetical protein